MNFKTNYQYKTSVTNRILVMKFMSEFILIYPLITIMYGDYGRVNAAGIGVILAVSLILPILFEIPTGIIADKIPRKFVLILSLLFKIFGLISLIIFPFFSGYILSAVLLAMSTALESGALQAYLYGTLGSDNQKFFGKFWARVGAMVMVSYTTAYLFTSLIGVNYPLLIGLSAIPCLIALCICISLPTDKIDVSQNTAEIKVFRSAIGHIKGSKELIKLLISGVIMVALAYVLIEYISLYYRQIGIATRAIPIIMALGNLIGAALFWTLHSWEKWLDKYKLILLVIASGLFSLTFSGGLIVAAVGILLYTRLIRVLQVQYESKLQHLANNEARATISSIGSFGASILAGISTLIIGSLAVDNVILQPLRISLLIGSFVFIAVHAFIRYSPKNTN